MGRTDDRPSFTSSDEGGRPEWADYTAAASEKQSGPPSTTCPLIGDNSMSSFREVMRRVITGDNAQGKSVVIIDGGPSSEIGNPDLGGLFEIWEDAASGVLDPRLRDDLGATRPVLGPRQGNLQVRWFVINPMQTGIPKADLDNAVRERFAAFDGAHHIIDQSDTPACTKHILLT
jgi:hypothetical protein